MITLELTERETETGESFGKLGESKQKPLSILSTRVEIRLGAKYANLL